MEINYAEICRTCLRKPTDFRDINESTANNITLGEMVKYCTSITMQVDNLNILSSNICMDCVKELKISYKFKMKTEKAHASVTKYLESRVQNIKTEELVIKEEPSNLNLLHPDTYQNIPAQEQSLNLEINLRTTPRKQSFSAAESKVLNNGGNESGEETSMSSDNCSSDLVGHKVWLIDNDVKLEPAEEGEYSEDDNFKCPVCLEKLDGGKYQCAKCEAAPTLPETGDPLLLAERTKRRYQMVYSKFMDWCRLKNIQRYSENCLLLYFKTIPSKKSLFATYSMLKTGLGIHNNVDISKFNRLKGFIRKESRNLEPKKSKVFQSEQIDKFIREAPDISFLLVKAAVIIGISGACRREELCRMSIDDMEFKHDVVIVNVPETETIASRRFVVFNPEWLPFLLKYTKLRVEKNKRFFLTYREGKCINAPVGLNAMGKMACRVAQYLKLEAPHDYTARCFWKTGCYTSK